MTTPALPDRITDYESSYKEFRWDIPDRFNFAAEVVDAWADDPNRLAMIWVNDAGAERRLTFANVRAASNRLANVLSAGGIAKGDRVLVMMPRVPEWQIAMVAVMKLGAVPIPCITMLTDRDIAYRAEHSGATAAITPAAEADKFAGIDGLRLKVSVGSTDAPGWVDYEAACQAASPDFTPVLMDAEDLAILYYTSGSTGKPKGVPHAARGIYTWRVSAWHWLDLRPGDMMWCTADTGWSKAGTSILFGPWSCGAAVLFHDGGFDPARRFDYIQRHGVTVFCASATELRRLVLEDISAFDLSTLRLTVSAGESVNAEIVDRWFEMTGTKLLDGYGQTETLITVTNFPCMEIKPGSMGKPLHGTEMAVVTTDNKRAEVNELGRLVMRLPNPQMMLGYWQAPELDAAATLRFEGSDWFITGDLVTVDADDYIFYQGRDDDMITSAGYRIGPMEVESALLEHAAVQDSAVVASPHPERGEIVCAYVVLKPGLIGSDALSQELQDTVKRVTAPYKYPRKIVYEADLPKTVTGKIQRRALRDREFGSG